MREGGNWSGYAGAQPLTTTDPSGLGCWDKGWNDPSCWWYHMQQRETWCQQHWYYCYMHGYLRCFWNCFPRRVLMPVLVISATWRQAYQQLMAVQQELSFAQHMISSGALTGVTGVSLAQIYERIAVLGAEVSRLQGVLRTIPRFSAATVIVYELYCVWRCYGSS